MCQFGSHILHLKAKNREAKAITTMNSLPGNLSNLLAYVNADPENGESKRHQLTRLGIPWAVFYIVVKGEIS